MTIKKIFLATFFVISATVLGQEEQTDTKAKPFFGLKAGINANKSSQSDENPLTFGFQIGATVTIPMSKRFSFQPEIEFQTINSCSVNNDFYSNGSVSEEYKTNNTLVLFPLVFKYAASNKVSIDLGPTIGYQLSRKETVKLTQTIDGQTTVFEFDPSANAFFKSKDKKLALAANLGTNYNFTETISLGFRYSLFISSFQNIDSTLDNSLFALSMGYSFK